MNIPPQDDPDVLALIALSKALDEAWEKVVAKYPQPQGSTLCITAANTIAVAHCIGGVDEE